MKALREWWLRRNVQQRYGVRWDGDNNPRCLNCSRLLACTREPHILVCSRCHSKHVLRTDDGRIMRMTQAKALVKESKV